MTHAMTNKELRRQVGILRQQLASARARERQEKRRAEKYRAQVATLSAALGQFSVAIETEVKSGAVVREHCQACGAEGMPGHLQHRDGCEVHALLDDTAAAARAHEEAIVRRTLDNLYGGVEEKTYVGQIRAVLGDPSSPAGASGPPPTAPEDDAGGES